MVVNKVVCVAAGLAAAATLSLTTAAPAGAERAPMPGADAVRVDYKGYFLGILVMRASVEASLTADAFQGGTVFRTAGLAGFVKSSSVASTNAGVRDADGGFRPTTYEHTEINGKKTRSVAMEFTEADVVTTVTPPFGSLGDPAATAEQRAEAVDPVTSLLQIMMPAGEAPCSRTIEVFDSKLRYNLVFEPVGSERIRVEGFNGEAHRCRVFYRPIAGFDPEDMADPSVYDTPFNIWLAKRDDGMLAPVRISARVSGVPVRIDAASIARTPAIAAG